MEPYFRLFENFYKISHFLTVRTINFVALTINFRVSILISKSENLY